MDTPRYSLIEETEALMVAPNGGDPFQKNAHFLKPIVPSSIDEPPFKLSHCFTSLPSHFDPRLKLEFHGWPHPHKHWTTWVAQMATTHQHTWKQAGIYEAILNSTYDIKRMNSLVFGFGEKWCCETNTFMFPWGEATITLEDVMVLGGYSVLGDSVLKPLENPEKELEEKLDRERKEIYNTGSRKATTSLWLNRFMGSGSEIEHQAFLAYWLCRITPNAKWFACVLLERAGKPYQVLHQLTMVLLSLFGSVGTYIMFVGHSFCLWANWKGSLPQQFITLQINLMQGHVHS